MSRSLSPRVWLLRSALTLAALALLISGAGAQEPDPASLQNPSSANANGSVRLTSTIVKIAPAQPQAATSPSSIRPAVSQKLTAAQRAALRTFERARAAFTGFCKDWENKLSQRERDNLAAIEWKQQNGWMVGQYLGYSRIHSCTCKQSPRGQPVGELTYGETNNYLTGKTVDEAIHSKPKSTLATETTEIFGWGKKGWEY